MQVAIYGRIAISKSPISGRAAPNSRRDDPRLVLDLAPGEAQHLAALRLQAGVSSSVLVEGRPRPVRLPAVDLDNQVLRAPQEVDLEAVNSHIHLRARKPMPANQRHEHHLQLGASARPNWLQPARAAWVADWQAQELRLPIGGRKVRLREDRAQVGQGAARLGHGNAIAADAFCGGQSGRAMKSDPRRLFRPPFPGTVTCTGDSSSRPASGRRRGRRMRHSSPARR